MKRTWWLVPVALAALGVLWILTNGKADMTELRSAVGLKPASVERPKAKPICASPVNPNVAAPTDCIPQHLANLPPDPGPAGMKTLEGIDSDKDGVRDDLQRYIAENWGHSERAVQALTNIAKGVQLEITTGDSVTRERAREMAPQILESVNCYVFTVDEEIRKKNAMDLVLAQAVNTPERYTQKSKFEYLMAHSLYPMSSEPVSKQCGYDPDVLPN